MFYKRNDDGSITLTSQSLGSGSVSITMSEMEVQRLKAYLDEVEKKYWQMPKTKDEANSRLIKDFQQKLGSAVQRDSLDITVNSKESYSYIPFDKTCKTTLNIGEMVTGFDLVASSENFYYIFGWNAEKDSIYLGVEHNKGEIFFENEKIPDDLRHMIKEICSKPYKDKVMPHIRLDYSASYESYLNNDIDLSEWERLSDSTVFDVTIYSDLDCMEVLEKFPIKNNAPFIQNGGLDKDIWEEAYNYVIAHIAKENLMDKLSDKLKEEVETERRERRIYKRDEIEMERD